MTNTRHLHREYEPAQAPLNSAFQFNHHLRLLVPILLIMAFVLLQACAAVNTFPMAARPGDTVSVMVGGSEQVREGTISATLTDGNSMQWDLQALGLVRSVFSLRAEGRAYGMHYSDYFDIQNSWFKGHEPIQTVLVFDVPASVALGAASLEVNLNATDDSSAIPQPFTMALDIVAGSAGSGSSDNFLRQNFDADVPVNFDDLEPAPHAKVSFGTGQGLNYISATPGVDLGAAEIVVDYDETILSGDDITVYVSESTQRESADSTSPFGQHQRGIFWRHDNDKVYVYVIAPRGIEDRYLQVYIIHPKGLGGDPAMTLMSTTGYDLNGNTITATPQFSYHPN